MDRSIENKRLELLEQLVEAVESISKYGICIHLTCGDDKMALDLAAMKIGEAIRSLTDEVSR